MHLIQVNTKAELKQFIKLPFTLYKNDKYWVAPLIKELERHLDIRKNPFFEYAEVEFFLVTDGQKIVGRISAHTNPNHNAFHEDKKGFFGFFESINNQEVANLLFSAAEQWLKEKGCDVISGPFNFNTNDECGLLVSGFDSSPFFMMTHHHAYYQELFENYGFKKAMDLYAWYLESDTMPNFLELVGKKMEKNQLFSVRSLNKDDLKSDIEKVFTIYQKAWEKNWGFVPMSKNEFINLVNTLLPILDPDLVFIAECKGVPVGFSVALPNFNYLLKKIKGGRITPLNLLKIILYKNKIDSARIITMGVIHEYHGKGIDTLFYYHTWKNALSKGYRKGEFSWVLETNEMMNKIARHLGANIHKTYRIYELNINLESKNDV